MVNLIDSAKTQIEELLKRRMKKRWSRGHFQRE